MILKSFVEIQKFIGIEPIINCSYNVKINFYEIFITCLFQNGLKTKNAHNLLKFDKCDISNIQISILMSKSIFINYLPPVRPKLLPKLNMLIIHWILTHSIFKICQSLFWCQKWFLLNIYHLFDPNWSQN